VCALLRHFAVMMKYLHQTHDMPGKPVITSGGFGCCSMVGGGRNGVVRIGGEGVSRSVTEVDPKELR
jgi:hypothetical protein